MINVDTDKIIPKQYLKTIERSGLGKGLFAEMRYRDDGTTPTTTVGMLLEPAAAGFDGCMMYSGPLSVLQFTQVTSPATLDVSYYR